MGGIKMKIISLGNNRTQVTKADGTQVLISYATPVACYDAISCTYYRTSEKHSPTTSKHITQWLEGVKAEEQPQAFFDSLI
jgi:hypothetical protein